jgi:hypothetical protein
MKFLFLLNSGYPTQKAYGITTKHTIQALISLGKDVELWAPKSDFPFTESFEFKDTSASKPTKNQLLSKIPVKGLVYMGFLWREISFSFRVVRKRRFLLTGNLVWVRDIPLAFWSNFLAKPSYVVLEVHHIPKGLQSVMLHVIAKRSNVILAGISEKHSLTISKRFKARNSVVTCPMAAPESFYSFPIRAKNQIRTLGYVGKYTSSGNENGISNVLLQFAEAKLSIPELKLKFIGIEEGRIEELTRNANLLGVADSVEVLGHLSGDALQKEIIKIDVGLIPYPESKYNSNRFPIKSVEYAALGITILATRTKAHVGLLSEDFTYFYDSETLTSLASSLSNISANIKEAHVKRLKARAWAETHSYPARVDNVLKEIERRGADHFYS